MQRLSKMYIHTPMGVAQRGGHTQYAYTWAGVPLCLGMLSMLRLSHFNAIYQNCLHAPFFVKKNLLFKFPSLSSAFVAGRGSSVRQKVQKSEIFNLPFSSSQPFPLLSFRGVSVCPEVSTIHIRFQKLKSLFVL